MEKKKRKFGDRKDATLIRDMDGLHVAMVHCFPKRTESEAYISETIETEPMIKWIEKHNDSEFKYTFFHVIVAAFLKTLVIRPQLNRFICNRRFYQRNERVASFVVKKQFTEEAHEGMALVKVEEDSTIFTVHERIKEIVFPFKQGKSNSTDNLMDLFTKLPHWLNKIIFNCFRRMSDRGHLPESLTRGDSNHTSIFLTNLGSIGLQCGYHHLSNYGTASMFVVIGKKKLTPFYDEKGNVTMKETIDLGLTIDERIADGYYYAKSMKILRKLLSDPSLLEMPFSTEVNVD